MKIREGFELRNVCGEHVVIAEGLAHLDFSKMIHLNETAAYLWEQVKNRDFDAEVLADLLCAEYEVENSVAKADSEALIAAWKADELVED